MGIAFAIFTSVLCFVIVLAGMHEVHKPDEPRFLFGLVNFIVVTAMLVFLAFMVWRTSGYFY